MNPSLPAPGDLAPGDALPPVSHTLDWEALRAFNRYVTGGADTKNIHTDDDLARRAGLPRAVATGRHPVCFITERMMDLFGAGFLAGGEVDVTFVRPIFPGETVSVTARVKERREEAGGRARLVLDVALVNPDGVPVTVGTASGAF